ncbi:MAG TPA: acyltransferase [Methanocellales archaeon]|nr:acyltransferase [Methanocellales archaeon]
MEDRSIIVDGDVLIGNHSEISYGLFAHSIIIGERVKIDGDIVAEEDIRLDLWSNINGDVRTKKDAYIGERTNINGKLVVKGDLDIGNDVHIKDDFEAKGWIVIRNPVPVIVYIILYLAELLRLGEGEEVDKMLGELFSEESDVFNEQALIVPNGTKITLDTIRIPYKAIIGDGCRMVGNIRAHSINVKDNTTLFGSIRTRGEIKIGQNTEIYGDLITRGAVYVDKGSRIMGEINADAIIVHKEAKIDGAMRALRGVSIMRDEEEKHEIEVTSQLLSH